MHRRIIVAVGLLVAAFGSLLIFESTGRLLPAVIAVFCAAVALPILTNVAKETL